MSTTKETKAGERTVKGWAVIVFEDALSAYEGADGTMGRAVFTEIEDAREFAETDVKDQGARVVPCTITYSLT